MDYAHFLCKSRFALAISTLLRKKTSEVKDILTIYRGGLGAVLGHCMLHGSRILIRLARLVFGNLILDQTIGVKLQTRSPYHTAILECQ